MACQRNVEVELGDASDLVEVSLEELEEVEAASSLVSCEMFYSFGSSYRLALCQLLLWFHQRVAERTNEVE